MEKPNFFVQTVLAGVFCLAVEARASLEVDYTIANPYVGTTGGTGTDSGYADLQTLNLKIDTQTIGGAFAGGIEITEAGTPVAGLPVNYTTLCTDIGGTLFLGDTYAYKTPITPFGTLTGVDPTWGGLNGPGIKLINPANAAQAIQNAAFLFYHYGGLTSGGITGTADQMAGLQLSVWEALYDTMGNGQVVVNSTSRLQVLTGGDATAIADANTLISHLNSQPLIGNFAYPGYLLFPDPADDSNGGNIGYGNSEPPQELLIGASRDPSTILGAVPEPSTVLAGALMLLPFGATILRVRRKLVEQPAR